jgi:hypothetical protein
MNFKNYLFFTIFIFNFDGYPLVDIREKLLNEEEVKKMRKYDAADTVKNNSAKRISSFKNFS